jgi:hypothetical protein
MARRLQAAGPEADSREVKPGTDGDCRSVSIVGTPVPHAPARPARCDTAHRSAGESQRSRDAGPPTTLPRIAQESFRARDDLRLPAAIPVRRRSWSGPHDSATARGANINDGFESTTPERGSHLATCFSRTRFESYELRVIMCEVAAALSRNGGIELVGFSLPRRRRLVTVTSGRDRRRHGPTGLSPNSHCSASGDVR